jgi:hypothetical protein
MTNNRGKENDEYELNDLKSFTRTEGWSLIPKKDKEEIVRRIRWLEKHLKIKGEPYNSELFNTDG